MAGHPPIPAAPRRPPLALGYALLVALLGAVEAAGAPQRVAAAVTLSAALAVVAGVRLHRPASRTGWHLVALGMAACAVPALVGRPLLAPLYILGEALLVAGLVVFVRGRGRPDRATVIDTAIISVALGAITWLYLLGPHSTAAEVNGIAQVWAGVMSGLDLVLAGAASILLLGVLGSAPPRASSRSGSGRSSRATSSSCGPPSTADTTPAAWRA